MIVVDFSKAVAKLWHTGQHSKDGPHIIHVRRVAQRVGAAGLGEDAVAVAWLHDVLGHTGATAEFLLGHGIPADIVEDVRTLTCGGYETYKEFIARVKQGSERARHVKVHCILDHLSGTLTNGQIRRYAAGLAELTFDYYS